MCYASPRRQQRGRPAAHPLSTAAVLATAKDLERVEIADDRRTFVCRPSGNTFVPWGFNYDHDERGRLLEDYWDDEWDKVDADFREMKSLGANAVRMHLQVGRFLEAADRPNRAALDRLARLLKLAEELQLYLDVTGLGCYHRKDVPRWYEDLDEAERWAAQACFWEAVARQCAASPAVFCYDLMNEPVVPAGRREPRDWLGAAFAGKHFVQWITLDQADRPRPQIAPTGFTFWCPPSGDTTRNVWLRSGSCRGVWTGRD